MSQSLRKLSVGEAFTIRSPLGSVPHIQAVVRATAMLPDPCLESLQVRISIGDATLLEAFNACLAKHSSKISSLTAKLPFDSQTWTLIFNLPALQNLDIAPLSTDVPRPSVEVLSMIQRLVAEQPLLKSLQLDLPIPAEQTQDSSLYSQVIQELMGLRNLETLILYVTAPLSLSESEVREMGASWPKIQHLQFRHNRSQRSMRWPPAGIEIQNDLSLLPSFLRHLPSLEELHLLFTCNPPLPAPQGRFPAPVFRILNVGVSPCPKASHENVVAYLAAVLPHAADVRYTRIPGPGKFSSWRQIVDDLDSKRGRAGRDGDGG
ncbi:hypothetical protein FRC05_005608 [Tulasnella sp. 425]|nr:hypothetical protein FRC05_005608 [Tulasnella sp. 425]